MTADHLTAHRSEQPTGHSTGQPTGRPTGHPTELRIALAMRGGVSLAVWMGGACRELARLRARDGAYGFLLDHYGWTDGVVVDVLAGTSAGGLNGVLFGWHLTAPAAFDQQVRDLWLRLGDLDGMTRSPLGEGKQSLLRGDDYFYPRLREAMEELAAHPGAGRRVPHPVRLLVTATRLRPRRDAVFPLAGTPLAAGSSRAFFRFRYWGDGPDEQGDFRASRLPALAYAGRTTSSFPGAFEPASPVVAPPLEVPDGHRPAPPDLSGVASETGSPDVPATGRVELIDGGVLDNIPLGWAVRTVAAMPAVRPVDRWLLYLQPAPGELAEPEAARSASASRTVRLLLRTLSVKTNTESVLDDTRELSQLAAAAAQQDAVLQNLLPAAEPDALHALADHARVGRYRVDVGRAEAARLQGLVTEPLTVVGPDPLPLPPQSFPLGRHLPANGSSEVLLLRPVTDEQAASLVLPDGTAPSALGPAARSPLVAARAVTLLLHVLRQAESLKGGSDLSFVELRSRTYALRLACEVVVAARDRWLLARAAHGPVAVEALLQTATADLTAALTGLPAPDGTAAGWRSWAAAAAVQAGPPPGLVPGSADAWPVAPYALLWEGAVTLAEDVRELLGRLPELPAQTPLTLLCSSPAVGQTLAAIEVLSGRLRPEPFASPTRMRLAVASAAEVSPLEPEVFEQVPGPRDRVARKLAGNQVSNFAAFLSTRWRLNDWAWGRMDGAQSLVRIVAQPERAVGPVDPAALRRMFLDGAPSPAWSRLLEERFERYAAARPEDVPAAVVERLHWDVVMQDLPLLEVLDDRRHDRPPSAGDLAAAAAAAASSGSEPAALLRRFGAVGGETVPELLSRPDLRRTLLRLSLVGWRALLPAGSLGTPLAAVLHLTVAPVLLLPLLLATLAPLASLGSSAAVLGLTALAARSWTSWAAALPVLAVAATAFVFTWRRRAPGLARGSAPTTPAGRLARAAPPWLVAAASGAALLLLLQALPDDPVGPSARIGRSVGVGLLAGISALLPVWHVVWASGVRGSAGLVVLGRRALGAVSVGLVAGVAAGTIVQLGAASAATAFWALYAGLLTTLIALYVWLSFAVTRASELPGARAAA